MTLMPGKSTLIDKAYPASVQGHSAPTFFPISINKSDMLAKSGIWPSSLVPDPIS